MATETDAARDRVLAARAALGEELEVFEASARAAVDVPAKIRRSPGKAVAIAGGTAFVVLGGPKRIYRRGKKAIFGAPAPLPASLLPDQVEKALRELGDDGTKVRGALERDFAAYAKQAQRDRASVRTLLLLTVGRPLLNGATNALTKWLFRTDDEGFQARLQEIRDRATHASKDGATPSVDDDTANAADH